MPAPAPSRDGPRVNEDIRVPQVRLIDQEGEMLGVMATRDAIGRAYALGLDLLEISPNADPPVGKNPLLRERAGRGPRKHTRDRRLRAPKRYRNPLPAGEGAYRRPKMRSAPGLSPNLDYNGSTAGTLPIRERKGDCGCGL